RFSRDWSSDVCSSDLPSEQDVWTRLRDGLGEDDVLIANLRLTDETKDHEADLVVLMPEVGIVVIEVKGGSVWHDGRSWQIRRGEIGRASCREGWAVGV